MRRIPVLLCILAAALLATSTLMWGAAPIPPAGGAARTPTTPAGGATRSVATPAAAGQADWPQWLGPQRDGKSPDKGLLKEWPADGPPRLWQNSDIGVGFSGVAVANGTVYITGDQDGKMTLFALDLDGKLKWKVAHDNAWTANHPGARATPTIDGNNLYIMSGHGLLGCYDAKTGKPIWGHKMSEFGGGVPGWGYAESVLIYGNAVIATPGGKNCMVALNKLTGKPVWSSTGFSGGAHYSSPILLPFDKTPMIVNGTGGGLVCVSATTGAVVWSNPFAAGNTANCPTPAYADGYVFWACGYGKGGICMKVDVAGGRVSATQAYTTADMECHHGGYIIDNGYIYGNNGGGWACLDLKTGQKKWQERAVGKGSLCYADGMLYLFGESGGQAALGTCSPDGLQIKGRFSVKGSGPSWAHPVVIGGRLYLRYDTNLYCFDVKAK